MAGTADPSAEGCSVRLCQATLPHWCLRACAVHSWFECLDQAKDRSWRRWEVWQHPRAGGEAWGHLHRGLMPIGMDVGGGPSRILASFEAAEASRLAKVLEASPVAYPWAHWYRVWPGPNSNTFAAWVLAQAGIREPCDGRAIGADYAPWGWLRDAHGVGFHGPLAGLHAATSRCAGQVLGLRFQVGFRPWRLLTPLGDLGRRSRMHPLGRQAVASTRGV